MHITHEVPCICKKNICLHLLHCITVFVNFCYPVKLAFMGALTLKGGTSMSSGQDPPCHASPTRSLDPQLQHDSVL